MESPFRTIAVGVVCLLLFAGPNPGAEPNSTGTDLPAVTAVVITCHKMIDDGLLESIKRRTAAALEQGADYLIYDIDTFGGGLFAAYSISAHLMDEVNPRAATVAYVSRKAISAGALISVACEDIIMKEKTRIGDCAPIALGGKLEGVQREKLETDTREVFATGAEYNGYPEALLKAMVTLGIEVFRIENIATGKYEFFEGDRLPKDANEYDLENKELIVSSDELLTLTASKAVEYGVARTQVKNLQGVLDFLAERDGVAFAGEPMVLRTNWSEEMVRWLNSPAVMAVLVMIAMLGVYIEFNTPGLGLPGLAAVICFVIIIGSKHMVGLANWVEVLLFVVGVLLLLVEIFILPGFGIAGFAGIFCVLAGLYGMLIENLPDEFPWPQDALAWSDFTSGIVALCLGFVGFAICAWLIAKYMPKTELPFLSGLFLVPAARGGAARISMTVPAGSETRSVGVGDAGDVVLTLRPTGKARFGDAVVDVVAEAEFIDKGSKVEIIEIHGNRVVVKAVEEQS
ncbi:MAG: NfeD family protein [Planctomycetota bacterium]